MNNGWPTRGLATGAVLKTAERSDPAPLEFDPLAIRQN